MRITILFCIIAISFQVALAQIGSNLFAVPEENPEPNELASGLDLYAAHKNSAIDHYDNYENSIHYILSPYLFYQFNQNMRINMRLHV